MKVTLKDDGTELKCDNVVLQGVQSVDMHYERVNDVSCMNLTVHFADDAEKIVTIEENTLKVKPFNFKRETLIELIHDAVKSSTYALTNVYLGRRQQKELSGLVANYETVAQICGLKIVFVDAENHLYVS